MGIVLIILLVALEIGLLVMTVIGGSEKNIWRRNRFVLSVIELAAFTLLMLLPMVEYNFRFKICGIVLVIRCIVAALFYFVKRNKDEGKIGTGALVGKLIGNVCIIVTCLVPALLFTGYNGFKTGGPYEIKTAEAILIDGERIEKFETDGSMREVPVYFYYPDTEEGKFPLIIFSHGAFGYYQSNSSTYMELASRGYVVVSMDHPYHSFFTKDTAGKLVTVNPDFINSVMAINQEDVSEEEVFACANEWVELRKGDMNLAINSIKEASEKGKLSDAWYTAEEKEIILGVINITDCDKIGVMGHSLGGAEAVYIGRTRDDIGAVIDLDGSMLSERLDIEGDHYVYSKDPYPVPVLTIDNEEHYELGAEMGNLYVNHYVVENAIDGHSTYFKGSEHMNFTDLPMFSPFLARMLGTGSIDSESCIRQTNDIVLMFFDYYLKDKGELTLKEYYQ